MNTQISATSFYRYKVLERALELYGIQEDTAPGRSNPTILKWLQRLLPSAKDDSLSWCAAFVNQVLYDVGIEGTNSLAARSFINWGAPQYNDLVRPGDLVIFWRDSPNSWKGHVGFFIKREGGNIYVLGGNQSNQVNIKPYPVSRLLRVRTYVNK